MRDGGRWTKKKTEEIEHIPLGGLVSVKRKGRRSTAICRWPGGWQCHRPGHRIQECLLDIRWGFWGGSGFRQIKVEAHLSGDSFSPQTFVVGLFYARHFARH